MKITSLLSALAMAALLVSGTSARRDDSDDYGEEEEEEYEDHEEEDHEPRRRKSKGSHKSNDNNLLGGFDSSKYDVSVLLHPKGKTGPGMQAAQMLHESAAESPQAVAPAPQAAPPPQAIYPAVQQYGRSQGGQESSSGLGTLLACGLVILVIVLAAVAIGMLYFKKFQKKNKKGSKSSMGSSIIGSQTSSMGDRKGSRLGSKTSNNPKGSRKGSRATSKGSAIDSPYSASKSGPFKLTQDSHPSARAPEPVPFPKKEVNPETPKASSIVGAEERKPSEPMSKSGSVPPRAKSTGSGFSVPQNLPLPKKHTSSTGFDVKDPSSTGSQLMAKDSVPADKAKSGKSLMF